MGIVDHRLVTLELCAKLIHHGPLRVHGLFAGQVLVLQQQVSIQISFRIHHLRLVLRLGGESLLVCSLIRARIDLCEQVETRAVTVTV